MIVCLIILVGLTTTPSALREAGGRRRPRVPQTFVRMRSNAGLVAAGQRRSNIDFDRKQPVQRRKAYEHSSRVLAVEVCLSASKNGEAIEVWSNKIN